MGAGMRFAERQERPKVTLLSKSFAWTGEEQRAVGKELGQMTSIPDGHETDLLVSGDHSRDDVARVIAGDFQHCVLTVGLNNELPYAIPDFL